MEKKFNKVLAWGIVAAVFVVFIVGWLISFGVGGTLNETYFVSDGHKLATSSIEEMPEELPTSYSPIVTHYVYYYTDETVTGAKIFMEFNSEAEAQTVCDELSLDGDGEIVAKTVNGKYFVLDTDSEAFTDVTTTALRSQLEEARQSETYAEYIDGEWVLVNEGKEENE